MRCLFSILIFVVMHQSRFTCCILEIDNIHLLGLLSIVDRYRFSFRIKTNSSAGVNLSQKSGENSIRCITGI